MIPLHASLSVETLQATLEASCALPAIRITPAVPPALEWAARYRLRQQPTVISIEVGP